METANNYFLKKYWVDVWVMYKIRRQWKEFTMWWCYFTSFEHLEALRACILASKDTVYLLKRYM